MFSIEWTARALKESEKLEKAVFIRILQKIEELKEDPFSKDIKRLKGETSFRLRVGDYRVIFDILGDKIFILKLGHRKNIYDE
jgi:mRNA interferase RelE/StbE